VAPPPHQSIHLTEERIPELNRDFLFIQVIGVTVLISYPGFLQSEYLIYLKDKLSYKI